MDALSGVKSGLHTAWCGLEQPACPRMNTLILSTLSSHAFTHSSSLVTTDDESQFSALSGLGLSQPLIESTESLMHHTLGQLPVHWLQSSAP